MSRTIHETEPSVIAPDQIQSTYDRIVPHIRRTPVVEVDSTDFNLSIGTLTLKLELLQHAGSFKSRGAFNNLLTRKIPVAGVVAASSRTTFQFPCISISRHSSPATMYKAKTS